MTSSVRLIKAAMVATIALFFTVVALGNIVDYNTNWLFVQHVMSMDTTFHSPSLMSRAITDITLQKYAYHSIIGWQICTAIICWIGSIVYAFKQSKQIALFGLFLGFLLYMVGFIIIGGEWFSMWQSKTWNGQATAGLFISLNMFVMIFLGQE